MWYQRRREAARVRRRGRAICWSPRVVRLPSSIVLAIAVSTCPRITAAQPILRASYSAGRVLATNVFLRTTDATDLRPPETRALSVQCLWQTSGRKPWHRQFADPQLGFGISSLSFDNPAEIGRPLSVYGVFRATPIRIVDRLRAGYSFQAGMAFGWKRFDAITNARNVSIGAAETAHFRLGGHVQLALSPRLWLDLNGGLGHWSTGALRKPNRGINNADVRLGIAAQLGHSKPIAPLASLASNAQVVTPKQEFTLSLYHGVKYVFLDSTRHNGPSQPAYFGLRFPMSGLQLNYLRHVGRMNKLGVSLVLDFDRSVGSRAAYLRDNLSEPGGEFEPDGGRLGQSIGLSFAPSYALVINRTEILLQPGFYLFRDPAKDTPRWYQRIGIRQYVYRNLYVGTNLRAYGLAISEVIEWNIGIKL